MMYAQISQPNLDDNLMEFNTGINLILPLAVYTRKQEKRPNDAGAPISNATIVTTGTKHAHATRNMTLVWRKWKHHPIANHTWPNWKVHWTAVFAEMRDINRMMAGESAFGANAMEEEEQARQIALSLNNIANASIQKNLTIDSLIAKNAQLMQALADMQIAMACMIPPGQAPPYSGTAPTSGPNPPPAAAPPVAPAPPAAGVLSQRPSHWGIVKPNWDKVGLLLDARLQGEGWAQQYHVLVPLHRPSTGRNTGQHHGQE
jgi:hypothetical protein